ncbi:MAG: UDP-glucose/GDP-mannose dehydrogenase family protein [Flavobacteriales bacterium]|nr:UDP-glucose/GDP-mannose dehydrogenase family protein [Flavobacteriales bacterium]MCB9447029.1 UDP-glucose/GDP-mannose dehydrogenase family protein [Flavobacteriales bacterium]
MNVAVIGSGYVGLVTGTCLAETGNQVVCVDIDKEKVARMQAGEVPIYEPDLDVMFERNIKQGRLTFTTSLEEGVKNAKVVFMALPTPPGEDGSADLSYVLRVAEDLGRIMQDYKVVVTKSTVPVGTSDKVKEAIGRLAKAEFDVVSNPEFLREGFAVDDFMKPDRVVVGTSSEKAAKIMKELYSPYVRQGNPIIIMDERSSELTKYAANAFLATKISFMNEVANLCEKVGADVDQIRMGIGSDDRIGKRFLFAGIGYGGSCFPKDVMALARTSEEHAYDFGILKAVMELNKKQRKRLLEKVYQEFGNELKGKHFALWGLAFKPDTDDIREAPALEIITDLLAAGATISAYDPEAAENVKRIFGDNITYASDPYSALTNADALLIATEWSVFRTPDFSRMAQEMRRKYIFDGRNLYDLERMKETGFHYESIGRKTILPNE